MSYPSFAEVRINDAEIVRGSVGGPVYSTKISTSFGGAEQRQVTWDESAWEGELGQRDLLQSQFETLNSFFRARKGRAIGFRHKDWADFTVKPFEGVLTPIPGQANAFQLFKRYTSGGDVDLRKIVKPVAGTVKVMRSDTLVQVAAATDYATGVVTLTEPLSGPLCWSGEFDVPVRFNVDKMPTTFVLVDQSTGQRIHQIGPLPIMGLLL